MHPQTPPTPVAYVEKTAVMRLTMVAIAVSVTPILLNLLGVDFGNQAHSFDRITIC